MSDNLDLVQVASNQSNKEVTINDQAAQLEAALTDLAEIDLTGVSSPLVLAVADSVRRMVLKLTGTHPGGELFVEVPANRKLYVAWNTTAEAVKLRISGGASVTVAAGDRCMVFADGIDLVDLSELGNFTPTDRQVIVGDGSDWVARALDAADIQSGTFPDARISESAVTQHEAALSILEAQITADFATYAAAGHNHAHDSLTGVVADEHGPHSGVDLTAGVGLLGGGDISQSRSFAVDVGIGDDQIVQVDDPGATAGEYLRFTANGAEGEIPAEVPAAVAFDPSGHGDKVVRVNAVGDGLEPDSLLDKSTGAGPAMVLDDNGLALNRGSADELLHIQNDGILAKLARNTSGQHALLINDIGGFRLESRSDPGNAKRMIVRSTTDDAHTAPSAGNVGILFDVLAETVLSINPSDITISTGKQVLAPSESELAPSYSFISDPDMGLFRAGSDVLGIATAGVERVRIDASGDVGIGGDPLFDLHVLRPGAVLAGLETQGAADAARFVFRSPASATGQHRIEFGDGDDFDIGQIVYDHGLDALGFDVNASRRMTIGSGGRVGVGTQTPAQLFDVTGTSTEASQPVAGFRDNRTTTGDDPNSVLDITRQNNGTAAGILGNDGNDDFLIGANNSDLRLGRWLNDAFDERMRVTNDGDVGIGVADPLAPLHVERAGDASIRVRDPGNPAGHYLRLLNSTTAISQIAHLSASGNAAMRIDPIPDDGTSSAFFDIFRGTNTSGTKAVAFKRGDGTNTNHALIGVDGGDTVFGVGGGGVGIFEGAPAAATLDVDGDVHATGDLDVDGALVLGPNSELAIAAGEITVVGSLHRVDTEADAASGDLDTINGGLDGQVLVLRSASSSRAVALRDGTGNLILDGDFTMDSITDTIELLATGPNWTEIGRSSNG